MSRYCRVMPAFDRFTMASWITVLTCVVALPGKPTAFAADGAEYLRTAFQKHCVTCHGQEQDIAGDVNLSKWVAGAQPLRAELLEDLIAVLRDRQMPPEDEPPVPDEVRQQMIVQLETLLRQSLQTYPFEPTPIRRMNRFQYNNAVVDLLELDRDIFQLNERLMRRRDDYFRPESGKMPDQVRISSRPLSKDIDNQRPEGFRGVAAFPQDKRAEHGFDNRADHLTLSPLLMESFLKLSQTIAASPDLNANECRSWNRVFADPGDVVRGPMDGKYEADNPRLAQVVGKPQGDAARQELRIQPYKWSGDAHLFWRCPRASLELVLAIDIVRPATGLQLALTQAPDYGVFDVYLDDKKIITELDLYHVGIARTEQTVDSLKIEPGRHTLKFKCVGKNAKSKRFYFGVDTVQLTGMGALASPNQAQVAVVDAVRTRLKPLLRRAFRRPVDDDVLDRFTDFARQQLEAGQSFEQTMRTMVSAVLGMPDFLYLYETHETDRATGSTNNAGGAPAPTDEKAAGNQRGREPVNDFELASRLAQFFWSSIPDDDLLDLAEAGKLRESRVLSAQIDRMLNDQRSARFCDNFPGQWLQLERLITAVPDRKTYPYFYYAGYRSSMHMMSEPLLLFETVFVEDRSIMDLIAPDYTWESDMLRANYAGHSRAGGDVQVQVFRRVPLKDPRRGGVITNAAVMTMTSTPTRTQPITRGAWVNTVIFNDPPEPPPADVPALPEADAEALEKLTIRERLALHRERADCAGCHNKIDPLGFALENYGPTGIWRDQYENGRDVDPAGRFFNQHDFTTPVEFKKLIVKDKQRFIRAFVAHLLAYALGRELGPADSPALDEITARALAGDDSMRDLLKGVAMSAPFLHKNTRPAVAVSKSTNSASKKDEK